MRKNIYLILSLLVILQFQTYCQKINPEVLICGHIYADDTSFTKFKVSLCTSYTAKETPVQTTFADSNRNYIFIVPRETIKSQDLLILVSDIPKSITKKSYCDIFQPRPKYLLGQIRLKSKETDSIDVARHDIQLIKICYTLRFPCIEFDENSLEMKNCYSDNPDSTIKCFADLLNEYPTFVIEISAHSDRKEKDPESIALYRGQMIRNMLIALGINPNRLVVKGFGNKREMVTENEIKKLKIVEEKNVARQHNRRVVFSILRKDFTE